MNATQVLEQARRSGISVVKNEVGGIKVCGKPELVNQLAHDLKQHKAEIIRLLDRIEFRQWWRLHFLNRDAELVSILPPTTLEQMSVQHPDAEHIEPASEPDPTTPDRPLTADEVRRIGAWLDLINEHDPATRHMVSEQAQSNQDARNYYLAEARDRLGPITWTNSRPAKKS